MSSLAAPKISAI